MTSAMTHIEAVLEALRAAMPALYNVDEVSEESE